MDYDLGTRDIAQLVKYLPPMQEAVGGSILALRKWGCANECLQPPKWRLEHQRVRASLALW